MPATTALATPVPAVPFAPLEGRPVKPIAQALSGGGWVDAVSSCGRYRACALVFAEPSEYGMPGARRVSKLQIVRAVNGKPAEHGWDPRHALANFDRGWDTRPNAKLQPNLAAITKALAKALDRAAADAAAKAAR